MDLLTLCELFPNVELSWREQAELEQLRAEELARQRALEQPS